jgi:putative hydrolase of the HAD superfamily
MIRSIIFDIGGVMVDIPNLKYYNYLARASGLGVNKVISSIEKNTPLFESGRIEINEYESNIAKELGILPSQVLWVDFYKKIAKLNMNTVSLIKKLKKSYQIAYLSNVDYFRYTYTKKHILNKVLYLFDYKLASCELGCVKPSREIYLKTLSIIGSKPQEALFVDDVAKNVVGARRVGINALVFESLQKLKSEMEKNNMKF